MPHERRVFLLFARSQPGRITTWRARCELPPDSTTTVTRRICDSLLTRNTHDGCYPTVNHLGQLTKPVDEHGSAAGAGSAGATMGDRQAVRGSRDAAWVQPGPRRREHDPSGR